MPEELVFCRMADPRRDHLGSGVVYVHSWATGYQQLIFATHEEAQGWATKHEAEYSGPLPKGTS